LDLGFVYIRNGLSKSDLCFIGYPSFKEAIDLGYKSVLIVIVTVHSSAYETNTFSDMLSWERNMKMKMRKKLTEYQVIVIEL